MKPSSLIAPGLFAMAAFVFLVPSPKEGAGVDGGGTDDPQETIALAKTTPDAGWNRDVTLSRAADGHFYADVDVDGRSYSMLVDTGASVVALTAQDADSMGVRWDPGDLQYVARGAGGPVQGTHATIDRMRVGDIEVSNVQAVVIPEGLDVSLLGQTYLARVANVSIAGDAMTLAGE